MKKGRIEEIQALRAWAFLGVFLHHSAFFFDWGYVGVSAFFVLAGFFTTLGMKEDAGVPAPFHCIKRSLQKTFKLYPLHIVMLCLITPLVMDGVVYGWQLGPVKKQFILNILLLQSCSPDHYDNISFNGVSWFLSAMMILYLIIPYLAYIVRKLDKHVSIAIALIALPLQIIADMLYLKKYGIDNINFDWFSYVCPFAHLIDTFAGCIFARIYMESKDDDKKERSVKGTVFEVLLLIATGIFYYWMELPGGSIFMTALKNRTVLYIFPALLWIWVFIRQQGAVSKFLSLKPFMWLGNMSGDLYLVHFVIIQYIWKIITDRHIRFKGTGQILLSAGGLAASILFCVMIKLIRDVIKKSKGKV